VKAGRRRLLVVGLMVGQRLGGESRGCRDGTGCRNCVEIVTFGVMKVDGNKCGCDDKPTFLEGVLFGGGGSVGVAVK
jgi:hypothetical protein